MKSHFVKRLIVLKLLLLLTSIGCIPHTKKSKSSAQESQAAGPAPRQPQESKETAESEAVQPPTPITGSYLVCLFSDPNRAATPGDEGLSLANLVKAPAKPGLEGSCQAGRPPKSGVSQQNVEPVAGQL